LPWDEDSAAAATWVAGTTKSARDNPATTRLFIVPTSTEMLARAGANGIGAHPERGCPDLRIDARQVL
jgi:hypothetical protein